MKDKLDIEYKIVDLSAEILSKEMKGISTPEREKYFILTFFQHIKEIRESRRSLEIIKILLELSPKKTKRITKQEYLIYHINNYLHEIYIFKLRVDNLVIFIQRAYKCTKIREKTNDFNKKMLKVINNSFYDILKERGSHVHQKRYDDKYINNMELYSIIANTSDEFKKEAEFGYNATKYRWKNLSKKNNDEIDKLIEMIYEKLSLLIMKDEEIIIPSTIIDHENNKKKKNETI